MDYCVLTKVEEFISGLGQKYLVLFYDSLKILKMDGLLAFKKQNSVKPLKGKKYKGIHELTIKFLDIGLRVFFCLFDGRVYFFYSFKKQSNKTPLVHLKNGLKIKKALENHLKNN